MYDEPRNTLFKLFFGNTLTLQHGAQDADVGVAVHRDAVDARGHAEDGAYGVVKGVVMDAIAAVEQRAVNIEEVGVGIKPTGAVRAESHLCSDARASLCAWSLRMRCSMKRAL